MAKEKIEKQQKLKYVDRTVTNLAVQAGIEKSCGDIYNDFGIPSGAYVVSFYTKGWSKSTASLFTLVSSSNGRTIYVISSADGTFNSLGIRLWYVESV